ncbi:MAG TPA: hypothetical protein VG268_04950 [Streptosporangiaceae bacterium]|nr:hypothetical protein [Streptosporangiaceae bacterium]
MSRSRGTPAWPSAPCTGWSQSRIIEATYGVAPRAWRRHLYLMLDAYRADRAAALPEPPLTRTEMDQATARLNQVP